MKYEQLIETISLIVENQKIYKRGLTLYYELPEKELREIDVELFFVIDEKNNSIELTEKGIELITTSAEDSKFFVMTDVGSEIAEIEKSNLSQSKSTALKKNIYS